MAIGQNGTCPGGWVGGGAGDRDNNAKPSLTGFELQLGYNAWAELGKTAINLGKLSLMLT